MINTVEDLCKILFSDKTKEPMIQSMLGANGKFVGSLNATKESAKIDKILIEINESSSGEFYCPCCMDIRNMRVDLVHSNLDDQMIAAISRENRYEEDAPDTFEEYKNYIIVTKLKENLSASMLELSCYQCNGKMNLIIYNGSNGQDMIILSKFSNGMATQNTPKEVAYYLDQAYKSKSIGANSAAVVMYRSALEHLLYEQGYTNGMLAQKIGSLENDIKNGSDKLWIRNMDTNVLKVIKDLGNTAAHTNKGDISVQQRLDNSLINDLEVIFKILLEDVYEAELKRNELLSRLKISKK